MIILWNHLNVPPTLNMVRPKERPEKIKFTMGENQRPGQLNETRPIRTAKSKGTAKLSEVIKLQNEEERQNAKMCNSTYQNVSKI